MDLPALLRPPAFALNLTRLPRELVVKVIDELPLVKILQVLSHKNQYLDGCVLNSLKWNRFFRSPADIASVIDYFILYREICRFTHKPLVADRNLARFRLIFYDHRSFNTRELRELLVREIETDLELRTLDEALLRAHSDVDYPQRLDDSNAWTRWNWVKDAKLKLNAAKARQLNAMAYLISKHPEKLVVKKGMDPSQGGRQNLEHIENYFRMCARKASKDGRIHHQYVNRCRAGADNIELVPYDRFLWTFLECLEKYPPLSVDAGAENRLQSMSLDVEDKFAETKQDLSKPFAYPEDITATINVVMDGLMYVYTGSPLLVVPRIQWSSTSGEKPVVFINKEPHSVELPGEIHRCPARKIMPHDDREYKWLNAFLKVVTWMEKNLGKDEKET